jgi:regulator of replication initiation timing
MSAALETTLAEQMLELRRQVAGLQFRIREMGETNSALQRDNDRLRRGLRLIQAETTRHRLAVETAMQEFSR